MDKLKFYTTLGFLVVCALLTAILLNMPKTQEPPLGAVNEAYNYQQFSGAIATTTLLKVGVPGVFGGIVITEDFAGTLVFYDATSSAAITDGTYSEQIADFQAASAEGGYYFDSAFNRGLIMVSADGFSFAGDITVLYN